MHPSKITSISALINNRTLINQYLVKHPKSMKEVLVFINEVKAVILSQSYATAAEIQMKGDGEKEIYMLYSNNDGQIMTANIEEITIAEPTDYVYSSHVEKNPNAIL